MDRKSSAASSVPYDTNAGVEYLLCLEMEKISEKLKLLDYDKDFILASKIRPLHKHYFAIVANPGEQFFVFTSLCAWLIRKCGGKFDPPQEFDDPNASIAKILDFLRSINVIIDFPPSKLKQGVGEQATYVLNNLCDQAIKVSRFEYKKPYVVEDDVVEEEVHEGDIELILEKVENEMIADYLSDDENDEELIKVDDLSRQLNTKGVGSFYSHENAIKPNFTTESWKLELERVLSQLKVVVKTDSREWRSHVEQMKQFKNTISSASTAIQGQLESFHKHVGQNMEKINAREKFLNTQLEPHLAECRKAMNALDTTKVKFKMLNEGVTEKTRILNHLSDELDTLKHQMQERGASMTDGTPLVALKKNLAKMKSEIAIMNIAIAEYDNSIINNKVRDKTLMMQLEFGADIAIT
ncbi:intraflagellar transport protein 57 homolog [Neocloeon triangulifer]|uniref:intraflagellar transport protein 57 homolog n=1 Tax=Neocloeon triangulifer TaxID=2078957 RepID=UPI00286EE8D0|nr:intraflagellar transport protein 57 homolog [Neocloeon triangulifer]